MLGTKFIYFQTVPTTGTELKTLIKKNKFKVKEIAFGKVLKTVVDFAAQVLGKIADPIAKT